MAMKRKRPPGLISWEEMAERGRKHLLRHMARTGTTLAGHKLWDVAELVGLLEHEAYRDAAFFLTERTLPAIRHKAGSMGLTKRRRPWTENEMMILRKGYRVGLTALALQQHLPGRTKGAIATRARQFNIRRPRMPPKEFGLAPFDAVRKRAWSWGWTMEDLAKLSQTGRYFLASPKRCNWAKIGRAAKLLGGAPKVIWEET